MTVLPSIECLYDVYKEYNKQYFNNTLPNKKDVVIEWSNRLSSSAGVCYQKSKIIRLSTDYHKKYKNDINKTLLHEMIHLKIRGHGKEFIEEMKRIKSLGGEVSRYSKEPSKEPRWQYLCENCNITIRKYKKYPKNIICGKCKGKFKESYIGN